MTSARTMTVMAILVRHQGNADVGCHWINGNLNANNSTYHEGDSTVQRLWIDDVTPGSSHTITFQYGTTKGGKHAYDLHYDMGSI
jgi:hypothetical protein